MNNKSIKITNSATMNSSVKSSMNRQPSRPKLQSIGHVEEEYIANLEKQVYYLELEAKLMKEKEVENRNNLGGYGKIVL
jgi:hypothetical protein